MLEGKCSGWLDTVAANGCTLLEKVNLVGKRGAAGVLWLGTPRRQARECGEARRCSGEASRPLERGIATILLRKKISLMR